MNSDYQIVNEITSLRDVHATLAEGGWWIFCGGEPWHGTSKSLIDCERILKGEDEKWLPGGAYITVFLVNPSLVSIKWGEIKLKNLSDVANLRTWVMASIERAAGSQLDNFPQDFIFAGFIG